MEVLLTFVVGIISGVLGAFYGPYIAEWIKTGRAKRGLRLALYRELTYIFRLVSDLFIREEHSQEELASLSSDDRKQFLQRVAFFVQYYKTFIYGHDLYQFIRSDFVRLRLFYQLDDAFVIEKTYLDFYRTFSPELCTQDPMDQYQWLTLYRRRFVSNVRDGNLSISLIKESSDRLHYGKEIMQQLLSL
jgi:hypothetical protein